MTDDGAGMYRTSRAWRRLNRIMDAIWYDFGPAVLVLAIVLGWALANTR